MIFTESTLSSTLKHRKDFPGLQIKIDGSSVIYLDNAATTLKPKSVVESINRYYLGITSNVHRGKHYATEEVSNQYEQCRYKTATLLGCDSNEIIFTGNTTGAINHVAAGIDLDKSDDVILFTDSHHSNILPWSSRATVHFVRIDHTGRIDLDHYQDLLKIRPRIVAITHCSNVTGIYNPIEEIAALAKNIGATVLVDAAQSIPHRKINVRKMGIDFLAFSAHKMLGPTGLGVLYGSYNELCKLIPVNLGGGMVDWVSFEGYELRKIPHRFEAGTPHIAGAYGLSAAINYLNGLGFNYLSEHERNYGDFLVTESLKRDYIQIIGPTSNVDRGGLVSIAIRGIQDLEDVARILSDSYGIMCRSGHLCAQPLVDSLTNGQVLRLSSYFYNTYEEGLKVFSALDEIVDLFKLN